MLIRWLFKALLKLLVAGLLVVLVVAGVWRLWPADPAVARDLPVARYVDMHVHLAGLGNGCEGCYVNPELRSNIRFPFFLKAMDVTLEELQKQGDELVVERLTRRLGASRSVAAAVVLAMDAVIDEGGQPDLESTQLYVPNHYVAEQARRHPQLYFGASINPYRLDALAQLDQAAADGAVLIKWIPAIQYIDPSDSALRPFYERMLTLQLPLLSHAGQERSFAHARDEFSDPMRLRLPLSMGLTVIAAHIGTTGEYEGQSSYERLMPLFEAYPTLFADISSLTQLNKLGYLRDALDRPVLLDRLVYGSDWPLQMFPLVHPVYHWPSVRLGQARAVADLPNLWDRDVALKQVLGVPPAVFERSALLLGLAEAQ